MIWLMLLLMLMLMLLLLLRWIVWNVPLSYLAGRCHRVAVNRSGYKYLRAVVLSNWPLPPLRRHLHLHHLLRNNHGPARVVPFPGHGVSVVAPRRQPRGVEIVHYCRRHRRRHSAMYRPRSVSIINPSAWARMCRPRPRPVWWRRSGRHRRRPGHQNHHHRHHHPPPYPLSGPFEPRDNLPNKVS